MNSNEKVNLLIIGQTPPPYLGQMISIECLIKANYRDVRVFHTRMNYSQRPDQVGKVRLGKLFHLLRVIIDSSYKILRHRIDVICYPPGADTVPLLRDIATLIVLRRFGRKLILVFHASGLCEKASSWRGLIGWLFRKAFFFPDAAIQKSSRNPPDGEFVKAQAIYHVPNGCADEFERFRGLRPANLVPVILFVGMVRPEKGIEVLLEAARLLRARGLQFRIEVVGEFTSERYREQCLRLVQDQELSDRVTFFGRLIGNDKWVRYRGADIFCFPTHYPAESFGNVVVEAMMFELPVVSTRWRGVPDIVDEGRSGFLTEIKNPQATADRLARLLTDAELRIEMGSNGRRRYLERFTVTTYVDQTEDVVLEVAGRKALAPATGAQTSRSQTTATETVALQSNISRSALSQHDG